MAAKRVNNFEILIQGNQEGGSTSVLFRYDMVATEDETLSTQFMSRRMTIVELLTAVRETPVTFNAAAAFWFACLNIIENNHGLSLTSAPGAPQWQAGSKLEPTNVSATGVTLTWPEASDPIDGVAAYKVFQDDVLIATKSGSARSHTVTGLTPGETYTFKVEAEDAGHNTSTDGPTLAWTAAE